MLQWFWGSPKHTMPGGVVHRYTTGRLEFPPPTVPTVYTCIGRGEIIATAERPPPIRSPTTGASSTRSRTPPHAHHHHHHAAPYGHTTSTSPRSASTVARAGTNTTGLPLGTSGTSAQALAILSSPPTDEESIDVGASAEQQGRAGGFKLSDEPVEPQAGCGLALCRMIESVPCPLM
jgi:hypothetical protein